VKTACLEGVAMLVALCALCGAAAAAPSEVDVELAKAHFKTGEIYYEAGRYPDAAREFEEAFRLSRRSEFLYNMGHAYDRVGDAVRALSAYRRFREALPDAKDLADVNQRIGVLQHYVVRLKITSTVVGSTVRVDGVTAGEAPLVGYETAPGRHRVEVAHEGYGTWRSELTAYADQDLTVNGEPLSLVRVIHIENKQAQPLYKRWWPWTIGAAVLVAGGVTAGVLASRSGASTPELHLPPVRTP
jgi:tetratricopeptide (TPR) repeat protein